MIPRVILILCTLFTFGSSAQCEPADVFSYDMELKFTVESQSGLFGHQLVQSLDFATTGLAHRLTRTEAPGLENRIVGPYWIAARPKGSRGKYPFMAILGTEIKWYDHSCQESSMTQAIAKQERVTSAELLPIPINMSWSSDETHDNDDKLQIEIHLEGGGNAQVELQWKVDNTVVESATAYIETSGTQVLTRPVSGPMFLYAHADGYASQWRRFDQKKDEQSPQSVSFELARSRYVTIRYSYVLSEGNDDPRNLATGSVIEGRKTLAHWDSLPIFGQDWQLWQKGEETYDLFGPLPHLSHHRMGVGGFALPPEDATFDSMNRAPDDASSYFDDPVLAVEGLLLYCKIAGSEGGLGYGKILVESISETPPPDYEKSR